MDRRRIFREGKSSNKHDEVDWEDLARTRHHQLIKDFKGHHVGNAESKTTVLSVWDFAGQFVFYDTHQAFFSRRAIYLLVTYLSKSATDEDEDKCYVDSKGASFLKISDIIDFRRNSIHENCSSPNDKGPPVILMRRFADKLNALWTGHTVFTMKVQALNGETSTVEAYLFDTAKDVKAKACEKLRLSTESCTLVCNGKELDDMSDFSSVDTSVECKFQLLPKPGPVKIKVQALNGKTCTVEAYRFHTAKDVKAKACEKLRLSTESCTLVFNGKELDDKSDLSSVDTSVECKFQLLPKTGPGLVDSVKSLFEFFCNGARRLVEWFPDIFMDMSRTLTEKDLSRISQAIGRGWQHLGAELGLSQAAIEQICEDNSKTSMKIFNMLRQWSIKDSVNATVNTLHNAMKNCRKVTFDMKAIERVFAGI